jgi:hypothetical protein
MSANSSRQSFDSQESKTTTTSAQLSSVDLDSLEESCYAIVMQMMPAHLRLPFATMLKAAELPAQHLSVVDVVAIDDSCLAEMQNFIRVVFDGDSLTFANTVLKEYQMNHHISSEFRTTESPARTTTTSLQLNIVGDFERVANTGHTSAAVPPVKAGVSSATKKGFGALLRASKSGELERVAATLPVDAAAALVDAAPAVGVFDSTGLVKVVDPFDSYVSFERYELLQDELFRYEVRCIIYLNPRKPSRFFHQRDLF